ncbi:uncharacterized protein [Physcomitrium patens]|uniref:Bromo domain-containing protein n=1 Tax=Physcomitrium patens TaxID=3218 RepID=A0A7I4BGC0_PHYPA|nr:uncharacterized protein LOC112295372 isoform X2 [Physcomitrium patens]|eukprot:XP_024402644.1 uncharacterized protein LOC112295372 isoform X2 [Physcomitrella patens]
MCVRKSGGGDSLLRGLDHPVVANLGKGGSVEVSGEGTKISGVDDHLDTRKICDGEDREAENGGINVGNGHGMQPDEKKLVVRKQTSLFGVLESLMSLDSKGDFMGPLDGYSASNHSKVIESPMCFAMMQEKIRTHKYSTWRMFVEDFERICCNALKCNQKRSIIWAAADDLLRRGKKRLEQYEGYGESLVAWSQIDSKIGVSVKAKSENVKAMVCQPEKSLTSKGVRMTISGAATRSAESKSPSMCRNTPVGKGSCLIQHLKTEKRVDQTTESTEPFPGPAVGGVFEETSMQKDGIKADVSRVVRNMESSGRVSEGEPGNGSSAVGQTDQDVDVEGGRDVDSAERRSDSVGEATESSSSYGSSGSSLEGEGSPDRALWIFEAESSLRDGNGAVGLMEDDGVITGERGKKALDAEWKQTRRGIEWRCHWLELKTLAIQAKLAQYENVLKKAQSEKVWKWDGEVGEGSCSRTVPVKILRNHPIVHRKHRRRAEGGQDVDLGKHPVFSRYEKRKTQRKSDDGSGQKMVHRDLAQQTDFEESTYEREDVELQPAAENAFVGHDSMEQLLWQVEALQVRVKKQKHLLRKEVAARKNSAVDCKGGGASSLSLRVPPPATQKGNSSAQGLPGPRGVTRVGPPSSSSGSLGRSGSGAGLARRKAADYDISNMVMPVNVGATFAEQVRHVDIEIPLWRVVEDANPAVQRLEDSSSDEETEDEHYQSRHAVMETLEKLQRYMPRLKRSSGDIHTVGKGKLKVGSGKSAVQLGGEGGCAGSALPIGPGGLLARSADNVPKRQRSNRSVVRRPLASLARSSATQTRSPESMTMKSETVKSEVSVKVKDADPSPVGSGNGTVGAESACTVDRMEEDLQGA